MPELNHDIMTRVFRLLKSDTPPPRSGRGWDSLHQQDLTTLMRVSSVGLDYLQTYLVSIKLRAQTFHDLVGPILYRTSVVDNLELFTIRSRRSDND